MEPLLWEPEPTSVSRLHTLPVDKAEMPCFSVMEMYFLKYKLTQHSLLRASGQTFTWPTACSLPGLWAGLLLKPKA